MKYSLLALLACIAAFTGSALSADIFPVADMTTIPSGSATETAFMEVCYRPAHGHPDTRANILFDLSPHMGWTAESAILNINVFYKSDCGLPTSFNTFAATEQWDETWTGAHVSHGTINWGMFTIDELQWYQIDVTDLVNSWLSQSTDNYGLVFESINSNQAEHRFYSIDAVDPGVRPYLALTFPQSLETITWAGVKNSLM